MNYYGTPILQFMALIMHYEIMEQSFYAPQKGTTYWINEWAEKVSRAFDD